MPPAPAFALRATARQAWNVSYYFCDVPTCPGPSCDAEIGREDRRDDAPHPLSEVRMGARQGRSMGVRARLRAFVEHVRDARRVSRVRQALDVHRLPALPWVVASYRVVRV